jgi:hypothetical protein
MDRGKLNMISQNPKTLFKKLELRLNLLTLKKKFPFKIPTFYHSIPPLSYILNTINLTLFPHELKIPFNDPVSTIFVKHHPSNTIFFGSPSEL